VRRGFIEKGSSYQTPKERKGQKHLVFLKKSIPLRHNGKCKGPRAGTCHKMKELKGQGMAEAECMLGKVVEASLRKVVQAGIANRVEASERHDLLL
jgi:hypothetical protein